METEFIRYAIDGTDYEGALIHDGPKSERPLVLVAPNWMGINSAALARGKLIAADRYTVFVVDMYGVGRRPTEVAEAAELSRPIKEDAELARRRMLVALEAATSAARNRGVSDGRLRAAVGFCFGGGNVLELARAGAAVQAVVSIHGDLATPSPARRGELKTAVLALHGAADPVVPKAQRDAFELEMEAIGAHWRMVVFGQLLHAYTDDLDVPGIARYDEPASRESYALTHAFIQDAFHNHLELAANVRRFDSGGIAVDRDAL